MTTPESSQSVPDSPAVGNAAGPRPLWERWGIEAIVLAALAVRVIVAFVRPESLSADPDGYVRLAESIGAGEGFVDEAGQPTAYRPPFYPLALAGPIALLGRPTGVLAVNLVCSAFLVWLTGVWGRRLFGPVVGLLAAAVVAFDPLLVLYTLQPMTEVPFTLLTTLLLGLLLDVQTREEAGESTSGTWILTGIVFALAALCRPTIWAWLPIVLLPLAFVRGVGSGWIRFAVAAVVVLQPWVVRNAVVLGRPVLMTTHGGYTLLLANNPVFYDEVVRQPWGTVWGGKSLDDWQVSLEEAMAAENPSVQGELARDRWMRRRALGHIVDEPTTFVRSCYLRLLRFWNPSPLVAALPRPVFWGVTLFNAMVFGLALAGLGLATAREQSRLWPAVALVVAMTAVHTVYWSNARMRAPLVPVVAVLAAAGATRFFSARTSS